MKLSFVIACEINHKNFSGNGDWYVLTFSFVFYSLKTRTTGGNNSLNCISWFPRSCQCKENQQQDQDMNYVQRTSTGVSMKLLLQNMYSYFFF